MWLRPRGVLLALALAGGAFLLSTARGCADRPAPNRAYRGVSSEFGGIDIRTDSAAEIMRFASLHSTSVGAGCNNDSSIFESNQQTRVPVVGFRFIGDYESATESVSFAGTFANEGRVGGTHSSGSLLRGGCAPRRFNWEVILVPDGGRPAAGTAFVGTTSDGSTVTFTTAATGDTIRDVVITRSRACAQVSGDISLDRDGYGQWAEGDATTGRTVLLRVAVSVTRAVGGYIVDRRDPRCGTSMGTFVAEAVGPADTSTPAPPATATATATATAASGAFSSGDVPPTGFGLVVFGGGDVRQIAAAAACTEPTFTTYASLDGTLVVYVPGTAILAVNAAFLERFTGGDIPAGTPLLVRCR